VVFLLGRGPAPAGRVAAWPTVRRGGAELVAHVRQALGADRFDQVFAAGTRLSQRQAVAAIHGSQWRLIGRDEAIASGLRCMAWSPARTLDEPSPSSVSAPRRACGTVSLAMAGVVATEWFNVLFGVLRSSAPWVLTYTERVGASWTSGVIGVIAVALGGSASPASNPGAGAWNHGWVGLRGPTSIAASG
jgi:hypothetical protein